MLFLFLAYICMYTLAKCAYKNQCETLMVSGPSFYTWQTTYMMHARVGIKSYSQPATCFLSFKFKLCSICMFAYTFTGTSVVASTSRKRQRIDSEGNK